MEALLTKYQEVFEEGLYRTKEHLQGYCTPQVKCHPQITQRQVSALKEAIEMELDSLEKAGMVERVTHSQ